MSEPLSPADREVVRRAGAWDARKSRVAQGLPARVEDAAAVAVLAALLRNNPAVGVVIPGEGKRNLKEEEEEDDRTPPGARDE